jgi:hypothetical protein
LAVVARVKLWKTAGCTMLEVTNMAMWGLPVETILAQKGA